MNKEYLDALNVFQTTLTTLQAECPETINDEMIQGFIMYLNSAFQSETENIEEINEKLNILIQLLNNFMNQKEEGVFQNRQYIKASKAKLIEQEEVQSEEYHPIEQEISPLFFQQLPISKKGQDFPKYMYSRADRGSSSVWMLAFLTFLFESIFLVTSLFIYHL